MTAPLALSADARVRPAEWLADAAPVAEGRLVRGDALADAALRLRSLELPRAEDLTRAEDPSGAADTSGAEPNAEDADDVGAATLAWAMAYRAGFEAGRADGYQVGIEVGTRDGHAAASAEGLARTEAALHEMRVGSDRHAAALESIAQEVAAQATELAFQIARAVLDRELAVAEDPGADAVRRALAVLPGNAAAVARLHPDDVAGLREDPSAVGAGRSLEIVADPSIAPGDCRIDSGATSIDASVSAAVERVRAVLGLTDGDTPG